VAEAAPDAISAIVSHALESALATTAAAGAPSPSLSLGAYPYPISGTLPAPGSKGSAAKIAQLMALQEQVATLRREFDRQLHTLEVNISRAVRALLAE